MPDYNIYIHAIGTGSATSNNPTVPWSAREGGDGTSQTSSQSGGVDPIKALAKATRYVQNPDSAVAQGFHKLAEAIPWVAAAVLVVKAAASIVDNCVEFAEIESGDYRNGINWSNMKRGFQIVLSPVSSTVQAFKTQQQMARESKRLRAERDLLGDSVINSYTNKGV